VDRGVGERDGAGEALGDVFHLQQHVVFLHGLPHEASFR
jgi:hypothetical protein